jgi:hypothetical protein
MVPISRTLKLNRITQTGQDAMLFIAGYMNPGDLLIEAISVYSGVEDRTIVVIDHSDMLAFKAWINAYFTDSILPNPQPKECTHPNVKTGLEGSYCVDCSYQHS